MNTFQKLSPASLFANTRLAAQFWCIAFFITLGIALGTPYLVIKAYRQELAAVIIDPAGNIIHAPVLGFEEGGKLQAYHAKLACLVLLQRNPKNTDYPELIDKLFIEPARGEVRRYLAAGEKEFSEKRIQQKVSVHEVQVLGTGTEQGFQLFKVLVKGEVGQTGRINDLTFVNAAKFETTLTLIRNNDMLANARLPLVVYQFDFPVFSPTKPSSGESLPEQPTTNP